MNRNFHARTLPAIALLCVGLLPATTLAQVTTTADNKELKTLNDHFPFRVPESVEAWQHRKDDLRTRVLVATGLWPMPEKSPLRAVIHDRIERDGFTMEKVYFESLPGHFVSGMLFRPAADNDIGLVDGKRPAVLCPHGHGGRTMRLSDDQIEKALQTGAEKFPDSGRYPKLARCAHLARMGCVTMIFDMLGYADSQQISYAVAHRHANPRPEESNRNQPCLFGIDADLNLQSVMGLQTWNAIRALDFLESLPEVDPNRLGVTGGSGGGTQTILLGAIDPRVRASFPNGMVSTSMQGGCYCENCNYLRVDTGNVELAALFAPKPQGMTAANDWTKDMLTDGFPQLQTLYKMLGKPENVMCGDVLHFPHNYNYATRRMMYPWMAKHLDLPPEAPLEEADFKPFSEAEMSVWNDEHPAPEISGIPHERRVLRWWKSQSDRAIAASIPDSSATDRTPKQQWSEYRETVGKAWEVIFDRQLPKKSDLTIEKIRSATDKDPGEKYLITHAGWGMSVAATLTPSRTGTVKRNVIYVTKDQGSETLFGFNLNAKINEALFGDDDQASIQVHLDAGSGSQESTEAKNENQPLIDDPRSYSGFTFGYNRTLIAKQCEQILCVIAAFPPPSREQSLVLVTDGDGWTASAAGAAMIAGPVVDRFLVGEAQFRFSSVSSYADKHFVPGSVKYLDLPGLLALRAPYPLGILEANDPSMELIRKVYQAAGATDQLEMPLELKDD